MTKKPRKLTLKQKLFARYYILGSKEYDLRLGNATQSYALAYYQTKIKEGEKRFWTCASGGKDNLKKPTIIALIKQLKQDAGWNNDAMDSRLRQSALGEDNADSTTAIREYNRVMARIVDKSEISGEGFIFKIVKSDKSKGNNNKTANKTDRSIGSVI